MPIESPPPIVHPHEPVPNPNQGRTEFNANMQATFNAWPQTSASQEAMGLWMESTANQTEQWAIDAAQAVTDAAAAGAEQVVLAAAQVTLATTARNQAETFAGNSEESASISAAAANMIGTWTAYGANPIAAFEGMLKHDGTYWIPLVPLADASSVEPGTDPATWEDYIALVSGGLTKVTSATDTTSGNVVDVAWLVSRGIGGAHDASTRTLTNPNNLIGLGIICGLCDGDTLGISGLTGSDFGTLLIEAPGTDASVAGAVALTFKRAGETYVRSSTNATTWTAWDRLRRSGETIPIEDGGTGATTDSDARTALGAAASGAVTGSGLTMTTSRMLGRTSPGTGAIEQLTGSQVRSFAEAAGAGRVADTGITSASARMVGRVASGTGALEELTAAQALSVLGIATDSVTVHGASNWIAGSTRVDLWRIGNRVRAVVRLITASGSSSTASTTFTALIPAGFRPSSSFPTLYMLVAPPTIADIWRAEIEFSTNGNVTFKRTSSSTTLIDFTGTIEWSV